MKLDERIFIKKPRCVLDKPARTEGAWVKRTVARALWQLRCRLIKDYGADILQLNETPEGIEIHIEGELIAPRADIVEENQQRLNYRKLRGK